MNSQSKKFFARALKKIPGGVNSPVRAWKSVNSSPLFIARGKGSYVFDADKKKFMEAKDYYERLVEITPDDPMAWYNLAGVYVELDNPQVSDYNTIDMAIQCYVRTLELDPKHLEGSFKLMELALNHKKIDLAVKVMEDAVEQNPEEPLAYYNLISVYDKSKMFEQAEQARKRLKERFSKRAKESSAS